MPQNGTIFAPYRASESGFKIIYNSSAIFNFQLSIITFLKTYEIHISK